MSTSKQMAKHLRDVHFGGNWTTSNMKDNLKDVSWEQANISVYGCNTIATLVFHVNYYISAVLKVFQGEPLNAKDEYSFDHPPIESEEDWQKLLDRVWSEAETFAALIENLHDSKLEEDFTDKKYGTYYRNIAGIIEHIHYHLGQIALIKKIIRSDANAKLNVKTIF